MPESFRKAFNRFSSLVPGNSEVHESVCVSSEQRLSPATPPLPGRVGTSWLHTLSRFPSPRRILSVSDTQGNLNQYTGAVTVDTRTASGESTRAASASTLQETDVAKDRGVSVGSSSTQLAWQGFHFVSKSLEAFLDGTPFSTLPAVLNALIDIGNTVTDNKENMQDLVYRTRNRLVIIDAALLDTESVIAIERIHAFAEILISQAVELEKMIKRSIVRRIWESDEDVEKVKRIFVRLDECAKDFHIDISLSIERQTTAIFHSIRQLHLATWPRSRQAVYNADVDSTLTRKECTLGTRTDIISGILRWATDNSCAPIYWLNGLAGTGKSTIAYTVCKQVNAHGNNTLLASFFCSRQIEDARRRKHIIPTIVYQLAQRSRSYAGLLLKVDFDAVDASQRHMQELLVDPWKKSTLERPPDLPPRLIVIDALDECEGGYEFLKELLDVVQKGGLPGLKFLVTSRPDPKIVTQCNSFSQDAMCYLHEVKTETVQADVRTFLTNELPAIYQKPQFQNLVKHAGGLFIYAATAVRFISPHDLAEKEQEVQLQALLKAQPVSASRSNRADPFLLDHLYREILLEALLITRGDSIWRPRLSILQTVLCMLKPATCDVIGELLSASDADVDEDMVRHVVGALHAVLYISRRDGCIYWHHKSFLDFMLDSERAWTGSSTSMVDLSCHTSSQNAIISSACLRIMQTSLNDRVLTTFQSESFTKIIDQLLRTTSTFPKLKAFQESFNDPSSSSPIAMGPLLQYCCDNWRLHLNQVEHHADRHGLYSNINDFLHSTKVLSYLDMYSNPLGFFYETRACTSLRGAVIWLRFQRPQNPVH